jgi:hypothetical protein
MNSAPIEYPNNLTAAEYHELAVGSAIHPALIERNFFHIEGESVYDYLFISDKIPRKNAGRVTDAYIKMYQHLLVGGTWIRSLDPFKNWQPMEWGRIKPTNPRIDWDKGKPVKYESPPKTANRVTYFDVDNPVWDLVARRYNIKRYHSLLALRLLDQLNPRLFWEWVIAQIEIPIILCEGEKKAACLLSLGFVAIALPGIWNGRVGKQDFDERLHPDLVPMAQAGRKFIILFDYETRANTRWSVFQATVRTGRAIVAAGGKCEVALLPGPEKGVDDFVVGRGEDANALLTAIIDDAKSLKDYQRSYRARKWGLSKYKPDVCVHVRYLSDAFVKKQARPLQGTQHTSKLDHSQICVELPATDNSVECLNPNSSQPNADQKRQGEGSREQGEQALYKSVERSGTSVQAPPFQGARTWAEYKLRPGFPPCSLQNAPFPLVGEEKQILSIPMSGLLVLWSDMGTGKTELMRWWRNQNPEARFLNNGHRVNLLKNLALRLETAMYSDLGYVGLAQAQALSITIDSLHKLNTQALTYGCIFIDEACQYLTHLLHSNTCKEHRAAILEVLEYIIYNAPLVVIADAHMDDITVDFFRSMRPKGEIPYIVKNEWRNGERTIYWYEGNNNSALVAQISAALMAGQKIMVVSDSKRFIKKLEQSLAMQIYSQSPQIDSASATHSQKSALDSKHFPKLRIWSVHSDNSGSEENIAFIKDITNAVKNLDALLTSPSLGTGVDIAQYHFDLVFGVFHGVSQTATECAQQLYRYRPKVPFHVWVAPVPPFGYKDTNARKIKERLLQTNSLTAFLLRIDRQTGERGAEKDWALEAYCQIQANRHSCLNNLRDDLRSLLTEMGNSIVSVDTEHDAKATERLKQAAAALDIAYNSAVARANNITAGEYRTRQSKDYLPPIEVFECEKYRIHSAYGMEVTPELVELDDGGRLIRAIADLEAISSQPDGLIKDDATGREYPSPPTIVTDKDRAERDNLPLCIDWGNYSAPWLARFNLGLHDILKSLIAGGEVTALDSELLNMTARAKNCAAHIKAILGFTVPVDCEPIWLLATLLEQLGLKLTCRKQGKRGQQVKVYSLSKSQLEFALQVIAHRVTKRSQQATSSPIQFCGVGRAEVAGGAGGAGGENSSLPSPPASPASPACHHAKFTWQTTTIHAGYVVEPFSTTVSTPPHDCIGISHCQGGDTTPSLEAGGQGGRGARIFLPCSPSPLPPCSRVRSHYTTSLRGNPSLWHCPRSRRD